MRPIAAVALVVALLLAWSPPLTGQAGARLAAVDALFSTLDATTPGCTVGISESAVFETRAYGSADLEHRIPITAETIFEAGSVTKQFTAAAILLLVRDGKLLLDDPVRTYLPELPDYGAPLTIRHLLTHTSGLRDWGSIAAIGGWPRGSRVYTQAHVLAIAARQRALNFPPGARWSYTNTGYNLAAMIVERVAGVSIDQFTKQRIFVPLGMTRTSWRSDHTRVVPDRAIAYTQRAGVHHTSMPFENAYGNGGLLTTVGDLLKWTANWTSPRVGDAAFVAALQEPGRLLNGKRHSYAMGLGVGSYRGFREIGHDGSTAGYTADLIRFPERDLSIAVLCNSESLVASVFAHQIADLFLDAGATPATPVADAPYSLTELERRAVTGTYASTLTGTPLRVMWDGVALRAALTSSTFDLTPTSQARFTTSVGVFFESPRPGVLRLIDATNPSEEFRRVSTQTPTRLAVQRLVGTYASDEAETRLTAVIGDGGRLELRRSPNAVFVLSPVYADAFSSELGLIRFWRRDGRVTGMSVSQGRVWDLRFDRVPSR